MEKTMVTTEEIAYRSHALMYGENGYHVTRMVGGRAWRAFDAFGKPFPKPFKRRRDADDAVRAYVKEIGARIRSSADASEVPNA